jgi:GT2 family glycosyltransferase
MVDQLKNVFMRTKAVVGAIVYDVPSYLLLLSLKNRRYLSLCNRNERLEISPDGQAYRCDWQWTSDLYLPKVFPIFGRWLYRRAFRDFPIELKARPNVLETENPDVSFIIGHRGLDRLPLLLTTLKSIAGQRECRVECIVVEQDATELIRDHLPDWVRYLHTPLPDSGTAYSRAWAFNVGARAARSECLVFHDNDMLVPSCYARDAQYYHRMNYAFTNLKRFIFYLGKESIEKTIENESLNLKPPIESVVQNLEAGGSFVADKRAYFEIGGFDERFVGWGGEDNEFWERASTRKLYPYGYLPFVHLWHAPQPGKQNRSRAQGVQLYHTLRELPPKERIKRLRVSR